MLPILDTIISVTFVFLMFSLVVSAAREVVAGWMSLRGKELENGLKAFMVNLGDDKNDLGAAFFDHPFIKPLKIANRFPSYIPSNNVASALLHIASGNQPGQPINVLMLRTKLGALPYKELSTILAVIIEQSGANATLETVQANLQKWVDDVMERIGSVYQRKTRLWLLMASLGLAGVMNIDTVTIWQRARSDKTFRESLVAQAEKFSPPPQLTAAMAAGTEQPTAENKPTAATAKGVQESMQAYQQNLRKLTELGLPIGWTPENTELYSDPAHVAMHVLGLIISGFAASLGAPFWFDLLQKFMNIRSVLKPAKDDDGKGN